MNFVNEVQGENHDIPKCFLWEGQDVDDTKNQMCLYLSICHSSFLFLLLNVSRFPVILFREVQN